MGLRAALLKDGSKLLEELLGYAGLLCDRSTEPLAQEKVYHHRERTVETLLGKVVLSRDYFYCAQQQQGHTPFMHSSTSENFARRSMEMVRLRRRAPPDGPR
jgi:hypothetical protein